MWLFTWSTAADHAVKLMGRACARPPVAASAPIAAAEPASAARRPNLVIFVIEVVSLIWSLAGIET